MYYRAGEILSGIIDRHYMTELFNKSPPVKIGTVNSVEYQKTFNAQSFESNLCMVKVGEGLLLD